MDDKKKRNIILTGAGVALSIAVGKPIALIGRLGVAAYRKLTN